MPESTETPIVPPWYGWTQEETIEYLNSLRENNELTICEHCDDVYLFRDANRPAFVNSERIEDAWWVNPTLHIPTSRATLVRSVWVEGHYDFTTDWHNDARFTYSDEHYDHICGSCHEDASERNYEAEEQYNEENNDDESSEYVHDYSYRPYPVFFHTVQQFGSDATLVDYSRNPRVADTRTLSPASWGGASAVQIPYCGMELEMSRERSSINVNDAARRLCQVAESYSYLKWDGSVSNGFELVTHPHTLETWSHRDELWSALDYLRQNGWRSWNSSSSCGLHIHINNASFGNVGHAMRFLKFIFNNRDPLVRFAGRDSSYARFNYDEFVMRQYHTGYDDDGRPVYERYSLGDVVKKKVVNDNRYLAVNAQGRHTFELRFFKGNMNPKAVRACLEFVYALHEYSKDLTSHDCVARNALTWRPFLAFISRKSSEPNFQYRRLYDRLTIANRNGDNGFLNTGGEE